MYKLECISWLKLFIAQRIKPLFAPLVKILVLNRGDTYHLFRSRICHAFVTLLFLCVDPHYAIFALEKLKIGPNYL